jgi:hypothetical protein
MQITFWNETVGWVYRGIHPDRLQSNSWEPGCTAQGIVSAVLYNGVLNHCSLMKATSFEPICLKVIAISYSNYIRNPNGSGTHRLFMSSDSNKQLLLFNG